MEKYIMIGSQRLDWKAYKNSIRGGENNQQRGCPAFQSGTERLRLKRYYVWIRK
jgi:hypothetical protein